MVRSLILLPFCTVHYYCWMERHLNLKLPTCVCWICIDWVAVWCVHIFVLLARSSERSQSIQASRLSAEIKLSAMWTQISVYNSIFHWIISNFLCNNFDLSKECNYNLLWLFVLALFSANIASVIPGSGVLEVSVFDFGFNKSLLATVLHTLCVVHFCGIRMPLWMCTLTIRLFYLFCMSTLAAI